MSYQHSWFYPVTKRDPPDNSCRAGKVKIKSDPGLLTSLYGIAFLFEIIMKFRNADLYDD
jgi:hypothetical protein